MPNLCHTKVLSPSTQLTAPAGEQSANNYHKSLNIRPSLVRIPRTSEFFSNFTYRLLYKEQPFVSQYQFIVTEQAMQIRSSINSSSLNIGDTGQDNVTLLPYHLIVLLNVCPIMPIN
jgi:hypothetical protein